MTAFSARLLSPRARQGQAPLAAAFSPGQVSAEPRGAANPTLEQVSISHDHDVPVLQQARCPRSSKGGRDVPPPAPEPPGYDPTAPPCAP